MSVFKKTFLPKRFFKRARERFGKDGKEEFKGLETQITYVQYVGVKKEKCGLSKRQIYRSKRLLPMQKSSNSFPVPERLH